MIKKRSIGLFASILAFSLSLGACSTTPKEVEETPVTQETDNAEETPEAPQEPEESSVPDAPQDEQADVVVIGAGGAGMTAALQAAEDGAKHVVLLEKLPIVGGNTNRATGGLNAAETKAQKAAGIEDSVQTMIDDTMKGGKELNNPELVKTLADKSSETVDWLGEHGVDLTDVGTLAGATNKRAHRPVGGTAVGPEYVSKLKIAVDNNSAIDLRLENSATDILIDANGAISGVNVADSNGTYTINTKAVVITTGGFGANPEMVIKYQPSLEGFSTTNHAGALGEGITLAENIGAALVDMEQIQTHPTVEPATSIMITEGVRGEGAILVNKEGKRFINELETRDVVSAAELAQTDKVGFLIFNKELRDNYAATEEYFSMNLVTEGTTLAELAEAAGIDAAALEATINEYNGFVKSGKDTAFERAEMARSLENGPYYAIPVTPAIHHTMGGIKINTNAEVQKSDDEIIPGLFAAGEVTGGVHGANRLGGNAMCDIAVFGRISGASAAKFVSENGGFMDNADIVKSSDPVPSSDTAQAPAEAYKDGEYEGAAQGNSSEIKLKVKVEGGKIAAIEILDQAETESIFNGVVDKLIPDILGSQSTSVDTVSGGTVSSEAILKAVDQALAQAK